MVEKYDIIKNETKMKEVRYISNMGKLQRYDLAIVEHEQEPSKKLIINLRKNRWTTIGKR